MVNPPSNPSRLPKGKIKMQHGEHDYLKQNTPLSEGQAEFVLLTIGIKTYEEGVMDPMNDCLIEENGSVTDLNVTLLI